MFKKLNNKRGFSLVELMVVVAIMGTLASIAIPAFNSYRKAAKKTAYRTDLTALHKGWQAFGVELDSYCQRETSPDDATINNVGMESLLSSKLYGPSSSAALVRCTSCTTPSDNGLYNNGHTCGAGCTTAAVNGTGPGKDNYIGFGDTNCTNGDAAQVANVSVRGDNGGTVTPLETRCELDISTYTMGVGGHLSGNDFIGIKIDDNGVVEEQDEDVRANVFSASHANGMCA